MHHSSDREEAEQLKKLMRHLAQEEGLGGTGKFPKGQLTPQDEGELKLAIGHHEGKVVVNFGTAVTWFALDPAQARALAELLRQHSDRAADPGVAVIRPGPAPE